MAWDESSCAAVAFGGAVDSECPTITLSTTTKYLVDQFCPETFSLSPMEKKSWRKMVKAKFLGVEIGQKILGPAKTYKKGLSSRSVRTKSKYRKRNVCT